MQSDWFVQWADSTLCYENVLILGQWSSQAGPGLNMNHFADWVWLWAADQHTTEWVCSCSGKAFRAEVHQTVCEWHSLRQPAGCSFTSKGVHSGGFGIWLGSLLEASLYRCSSMSTWKEVSRPWPHLDNYKSHLAKECIEISPEELENVDWERDVWVDMLILVKGSDKVDGWSQRDCTQTDM